MSHLLDKQKEYMENNAYNALDLYSKDIMEVSAGITILRYATNGFWESQNKDFQSVLEKYYWYGKGGIEILRHASKHKNDFKFRGKL